MLWNRFSDSNTKLIKELLKLAKFIMVYQANQIMMKSSSEVPLLILYFIHL